MGRVEDILARKGRELYTIPQDATVHAAVEKMVHHNVGALVVTSGDAIVGIFTERDYLRRIALEDRPAKSTRVGDVTTRHLICVEPDRSVEECMVIMWQARIRHLPVMSGPRPAGLISIGDVIRHLSAQKDVEIRYLTDYITGKYPG
jgi:CBS domain-containing protein